MDFVHTGINIISETRNEKQEVRRINILYTFVQKFNSEMHGIIVNTTYFSYKNINTSSVSHKRKYDADWLRFLLLWAPEIMAVANTTGISKCYSRRSFCLSFLFFILITVHDFQIFQDLMFHIPRMQCKYSVFNKHNTSTLYRVICTEQYCVTPKHYQGVASNVGSGVLGKYMHIIISMLCQFNGNVM